MSFMSENTTTKILTQLLGSMTFVKYQFNSNLFLKIKKFKHMFYFTLVISQRFQDLHAELSKTFVELKTTRMHS